MSGTRLPVFEALVADLRAAKTVIERFGPTQVPYELGDVAA